ncbi:hypothetical protein C7974DRAFT_98587 [Boeremia exigua]|uniref:uncharacterized protein n=1 Tax=Boeremia exigua TaxID=749465 RepID=UPI001E8D0E30|nr:uncharacterized protein C7974DRAFT_98587 [Boeremia exigua]KAH6642277.1 hypothetical protein C7974DRAFT_98587 [Boeremia exigua]
MAAGNRKERRAKEANKSTPHPFDPSIELDEESVKNILKHPDRAGPKGKSLFELADERQRELDARKPKSKIVEVQAALNEPVGAVGDAILYAVSMTALHLTLDVIVYNQYREAILWNEIFQRAAAASPIFALLVYLTHLEQPNRFPTLRNLAFLTGSIAAGCYIIWSANTKGYFYVMKAAPPVGALWVWSVIEMSLPYAAVNVVAVAAYIWWNEFNFF